MFATQLIRILETRPSSAKNENCVIDADELQGNMKEKQNGSLFHINSPGRYADPLANEINDKDGYWNTPELECAMGMDDDFTNVSGTEIQRSHSDLFEKETELYTDKNVTECDVPELMICYKESGAYNAVKDIVVDEGIHSEEKNLTENYNVDHEARSDSLPGNEDKCDDIVKESIETESFTHKSLSENAANECGTEEKSTVLLIQDPHNDIISSLPNNDNSDSAEKGDYIEALNQDGSILVYEDEDKRQGHNDLPILADHEDDHSELSIENVNKSLLEDGPQSLKVKNYEFTDEFGINTEIPVESGIQECSDNSDDIAFPECSPTLNIDRESVKDSGPGDVVQTVDDSVSATNKLKDDASVEQLDSHSTLSGKSYLPLPSLKFLLNSSEFGTNDDEQQPHQIPEAEISKIPDSLSDAGEASSSGHASNLTVNSNVEESVSIVEESVSIGSNVDTEKAAAISEEETSKNDHDHDLPIEDGNLDNLTKASQEQYGVGESSFAVVGPVEGLPTYVGPGHDDETSDTASLARLVQRDDGESSFFMGGPVSGRIAYSGQIPYSGSISLRSESSTTSTRSFAFPVLQNEWNSSPVRMRKAERRRFHKHRGWRQGILCCRF